MKRILFILAFVAGIVALAQAAFAETANDFTKLSKLPTSVTAIAPATVSVTTTATLVHASNVAHCTVLVVNTDSDAVYCGQTNAVTTANGIPLNAPASGVAGGSREYGTSSYGYGGNVYCIVGSGTADVRVEATTCP